MKKLITGFFMAWGMFCAIPCPYRKWDNTLRPLMISLLPLLGLFFGALWLLAAYLLRLFGLTNLFGAALLTLLPWALSGFIHLDGYMDCCDAIMSRRDLPERQRILKDSHTGAFAVICLVTLSMLELSLFASYDWERLLPLLFIPAASRACSSIAVNSLKPMGQSSYAGAFLEAEKRNGNILPFIILVVAVILPFVFMGSTAVFGTVIGSALALLHGNKQLGGMSGDVSGYAITIGEACGAALLILS
jgi:adenosylcobinamide-GDP ribazoletransferase